MIPVRRYGKRISSSVPRACGDDPDSPHTVPSSHGVFFYSAEERNIELGLRLEGRNLTEQVRAW